MKKYDSPKLDIYNIENKDFITTSLGIDTSTYDEFDGIWDIDVYDRY